MPSPAPSTARSDENPTMADTDLIRIMYYGDAGKGKTHNLAHMAKLGKTIYIDAENRLKKGPLERHGVPTKNIERYTKVSYPMLMSLLDSVDERLAKGEKIVGIAWDSGTETGQTLLGSVVDSAVENAARAGKDRAAWRTELGDYGDMTQQMRRVMRRMKDLPIHIAMSCLAEREQDENGDIRVTCALTPAVRKDFLGYMDLVFHCRMEAIGNTEQYTALTRPFGRFEAKDSFGVFPRTLVNATFDRVVAYVNGDLKQDSDPVQAAAREAAKAAAK